MSNTRKESLAALAKLSDDRVQLARQIVVECRDHGYKLQGNNYLEKADKVIARYLLEIEKGKADLLEQYIEATRLEKKAADAAQLAFDTLQVETAQHLQYLADVILKQAKNDAAVMSALYPHNVGSKEQLFPTSADDFVFDVAHTPDLNAAVAKNEQLKAAVEKYKVVKAVKDTLDDKDVTNKSLPHRMNDACNIIEKNSETLEKGRDHWAVKFLKRCATFFTIGIAAALGIWNVKSEKYANKVSKTAGTLFSHVNPGRSRRADHGFRSDVAARPRS